MTETQAARTSYHEYRLRLDGAEKKIRERWELTRWLAWQNLLLSPNIKPANKPKTVQAFCRFPWEKEDEQQLREKVKQYSVSPEEITELNHIFAELEKGNE